MRVCVYVRVDTCTHTKGSNTAASELSALEGNCGTDACTNTHPFPFRVLFFYILLFFDIPLIGLCTPKSRWKEQNMHKHIILNVRSKREPRVSLTENRQLWMSSWYQQSRPRAPSAASRTKSFSCSTKSTSAASSSSTKSTRPSAIQAQSSFSCKQY